MTAGEMSAAPSSAARAPGAQGRMRRVTSRRLVDL